MWWIFQVKLIAETRPPTVIPHVLGIPKLSSRRAEYLRYDFFLFCSIENGTNKSKDGNDVSCNQYGKHKTSFPSALIIKGVLTFFRYLDWIWIWFRTSLSGIIIQYFKFNNLSGTPNWTIGTPAHQLWDLHTGDLVENWHAFHTGVTRFSAYYLSYKKF